jgi:hypothetical protein
LTVDATVPANAGTVFPVQTHFMQVSMVMTNKFGKIEAPTRPTTDFNYETDCRAALAPLVEGLLDMAESAGWDRRKAAYTLMFLSAQRVGAGNEGR